MRTQLRAEASGPRRPGEDTAEGRHQGLVGQVRTQLRAGIRALEAW